MPGVPISSRSSPDGAAARRRAVTRGTPGSEVVAGTARDDLGVVERRDERDPSEDVPDQGRRDEAAEDPRPGLLPARGEREGLDRAGDDMAEVPQPDDV